MCYPIQTHCEVVDQAVEQVLLVLFDIRSDALIFEVENLYYLHLQLLYVSRCGMVYIDPNNFLWKAVIKSLIVAIPSNVFNSYEKKVRNNYFRNNLENILNQFVNNFEMVKQPTLIKVQNMINKIKAYFKPEFEFEPCFRQSAQQSDEEDINPNMKKDTKQGVKPVTDQTDIEAWTKTIYFYDVVCEQVDLFMKLHENMLPDTEIGKLSVCEVQEYKYEAEIPFFYTYVPKQGTVRYSFLTDILIGTYIPTMYVCETGVDDFNMSNPDSFVSQPPQELLRNILSID
ncbi:MAG: hypothetical protein EZS28_009365 [Streblomastix strix]|uniref:Uncharacterized protein n=1 Tax=Streblomastix strix TaxID=222440 RepID=A0A5J4WJY4_9EUKA|nr:MAG: hypothetical protein EZS28_009365 [Streblomastix strix]